MIAAFRGPDPTVISLDLTPTFYSDEIYADEYKGYRVQTKGIERGSIVNERTLTNIYTPDGRYSEDFSIKFETTVSSNVYNVRVIRLRTILDVVATNLGLLAGLAFLTRFAKFGLMKCNVWLHLDREYNTYFKDDHRMSVTLNPPNKKPKNMKDIDYWEPNYPYTTKNIAFDENGEKIKHNEVQDGFTTSMNLHQRVGFASNRNKENSKEPDFGEYHNFSDDVDAAHDEAEIAPDEEHVPYFKSE